MLKLGIIHKFCCSIHRVDISLSMYLCVHLSLLLLYPPTNTCTHIRTYMHTHTHHAHMHIYTHTCAHTIWLEKYESGGRLLYRWRNRDSDIYVTYMPLQNIIEKQKYYLNIFLPTPCKFVGFLLFLLIVLLDYIFRLN